VTVAYGPPLSPVDLEFLLGTGHPSWLGHAGVPLFVSDARLRDYVTLPVALAAWALDSGGFTQLQRHGCWTVPASDYVARVRRYRDETGKLMWAAPQDWMCEPVIIDGGWVNGQRFVGTRSVLDPDHALSMDEMVLLHQQKTVENYLTLRTLAPELPFIPVIQGYTLAQYLRCRTLYETAGVDLAACPLVGLGSVCRRQDTAETHRIVTALRGFGVERLHGFGVKIKGLQRYGHLLASADSQSWSFTARRLQRPVCGVPHPRNAKNCANCLPYALAWRTKMLRGLATTPRQLTLDEGFEGFDSWNTPVLCP